LGGYRIVKYSWPSSISWTASSGLCGARRTYSRLARLSRRPLAGVVICPGCILGTQHASRGVDTSDDRSEAEGSDSIVCSRWSGSPASRAPITPSS